MTTPYVDTDQLTRQATVAVINHLAAAGVGVIDDPAGPAAMLTAKAQPAKPDRIIAVACYTTLDHPQLPTSVLRVQLWVRGVPNEPLDADDLADAAFTHMHGVRHAVWNGIEIAQCERRTVAQMGPDGAGRYSRSDNYEITTQRRSTA